MTTSNSLRGPKASIKSRVEREKKQTIIDVSSHNVQSVWKFGMRTKGKNWSSLSGD